MNNTLKALVVLLGTFTALLPASNAWATEHHGRVLFHGFAVPGATVTATQGSRHFETTSDAEGRYNFADLTDGTWTLHVELPGFVPLDMQVQVNPAAVVDTLEVTMLPPDQVLALAAVSKVQTAPAPIATSESSGTSSSPAKKGAHPESDEAQAPSGESASSNDGLLVNGSINNAATSRYSLDQAFGNQRSSSKSLYTGGLAVIADNSAFDARPYSLSGTPQPKAAYNRLTEVLTFGGPINIPKLLDGRMFKGPNFFVVYERTRDRAAVLNTGLVPTAAQRTPTDSVAAALLAYYPLPNAAGNTNYNYQDQVLNGTHIDALQLRMDRGLGQRDQVIGNVAMQSTRSDTTNLFGFRDATTVLGVNSFVNWQHRLKHGLYMNMGYRFSRLRTNVTPFFEDRINVSGQAGLMGTLQDPSNWGPPTLVFSSGIASLTDAQSSLDRNRSDMVTVSAQWYRGRHNVSAGGDFRREEFNYLSQQDPRGTFTFTGAANGTDLADFLAGIPDTASINYGNADKYLRHGVSDAYVVDDWRLRPELTLNLGVRWEYGAPLTEVKQRLANLDVLGNFTAVSTVTAQDPVGSLTGEHYPTSLLRPDYSHAEPRVGLAWRPIPASSLVIRAGYGIYADTSVYQSTALQLAEQQPFARSLSVNNSDCAQTLRSGPTPCSNTTTTTVAVDPNFRVGYAQAWSLSAQRDFPGALLMTASYAGVKGTRGVQDFLPNTYPSGAVNPCPSCPVGFLYRTSNGNSTRHAGTLQVRRRLRNGLTATVEYTYSRSVDDDSILGGQGPVTGSATGSNTAASAQNASIAQDWLHLKAERSLSTFDQRNLVNVTAQYTTGMGIGGGTLVSGWPGRLYKEWTVLLQASLGSGLPETPIYLAAVNGTGYTGSIRPDRTGANVYSAAAGHFLNAAAFTSPQSGAWGDAGRDSVRGPGTYTFNASLSRTFRLDKRFNLDVRADADNVLNHVVYASYNTTLNPSLVSPLFGLPTAANAMRSIEFTGRIRF